MANLSIQDLTDRQGNTNAVFIAILTFFSQINPIKTTP
jgi:hypothetical protein